MIDEKLEGYLKRVIYVIIIMSLLISLYLNNIKYVLLSLIGAGCYFFSYRYKDIVSIYLAFIFFAMLGFILTIPNLKEAFIIELLFIPLFISISKIFEGISTISKIKAYILFRVAYYLGIFMFIVINTILIGNGEGIINAIIFFIELFCINIISFVSICYAINKISNADLSNIYFSKKKIILYSFIYAILIVLITTFVFIIL